MEFKSIRSRTWQASAIVGLLVAAGCGDPEKLNLAPKPLFDINVIAKAPEFGAKSGIRLKNGPDELQVGDELASAIDFYAKPKKAYEFRDLPAAFGKDFKSQGWESDVEGFGLISFQGRVAVAMRLLHKVDEARVQNEVTAIRYQSGREAETVEGADARYWFWQDGRHRQMLCAIKEGKDGFLITISIGELNVMDALRMNPDLARADAKRADRSAKTPITE